MSDLISRSALIRRFAYYHAHSYGKAEYAYGVAVEEALNAPTIDAAPVVHGRWSEPFIGGYDGLHAVYYMTCSKCMGEVRHSIFRYCPNCGAKMDGGAE